MDTPTWDIEPLGKKGFILSHLFYTKKRWEKSHANTPGRKFMIGTWDFINIASAS